jgi:hypothetical protein
MVLMVCQREEAKPQKKLSMDDRRDRIAENLRDKRLDILGRQYLRELRRSAYLDLRL